MAERAIAESCIALVAALFVCENAYAAPMTTSVEQAYDQGTIPSARAVGMGGALNALGVSTTSLYLNPANMTLARVYHLEGVAAFSPEASRQTYGLAVVDSVLNQSHIAGGLTGTWSTLDPDGIHRTWTDVRGAFALPLGDHLSLGATGRWLHVEQAVSVGPFGPGPITDGTSDGPIANTLTFDVGATVSLGDSFRIAAVGHNLTNPGTALAPTIVAGGLGYYTPVVALEADGLVDFTTWGTAKGRVMIGGELFLSERYALRAGWRYDDGMKISTGSLGLGYIDPQWGIEVSAQHDLIGDHASTLGVLSLRYFYDALGAAQAPDQSDFSFGAH